MTHNQIEHHRKHFTSHWPIDSVHIALQKGDVFKSMFRVNAHNRVEAYCKVDGLPVDVLIYGFQSQNRAVEGDIVAIQVDPVSSWPKMKGSVEPSRLPAIENNVNGSSRGENVGQELPESSSYIDGDNHPIAFSSGEKISPTKRPSGRVVAIVEMSPRRKTIVGFLRIKQWLFNKETYKKDNKKNKLLLLSPKRDYIHLEATDPKFPKMMVHVKTLPNAIMKRLEDSDITLEMELIAAEIIEWSEEYDSPLAHLLHIFGRGGEVEPQISAILFQNEINSSDFHPDAIACIPRIPWSIPEEEFLHRRDLRKLCMFTIDPATASDLDDALSVDRLPNGNYRVGVHIADVSYFVRPDTALDVEAKSRSTSVYLQHYKLPMLPPILSDYLGSLSPGVERLAFSIVWDINVEGEVIDRWIGRTIIQSCCKLSYEHTQDIIDGTINVDGLQLYGHFISSDVISSVQKLAEISKVIKEKRFKDGALSLESPKVVFSFDRNGIPNDIFLSGRKKSNFLVEEFMLLANTTVAEVITRAYPSSALLRRHPEPNLSKLRDLEAFCSKHGLEIDTSTSGLFHQSLESIRHQLKNDSVFFHILMNYATRPMQLATYFSSGDVVDEGDDWGHYALAVPLYTHFTSPLRRYPDIIVHRTLAATLEVEEMLSLKGNKLKRFFTGLSFNKEVEMFDAEKVLSDAARKYAVPCTEVLTDLAAHCNERKLACRHVKDAIDKLYMWLLLRNKEVFLSEARVLGLGPRFMSIYVNKLAIERRIYYDEVEGLTAEWLDVTSTLILSYIPNHRSHKKGNNSRLKAIEEVAMVKFPYNMASEPGLSKNSDIEPAVFPLVLNILSTIPVAVHPIGGDDGPIDIGARLYMSSYFC
uniref:DIS3-like exonuclease 2 isoform X2 n=1 Tax=Erigeron canadensis TaxID=72917 RepID=UPI001CB8918B|nr:DIS3-like exonuclease 2 isoform X2 [Erigeron canadensis]